MSLHEWGGGAGAPVRALPGGAWLHGLRTLWTQWNVLVASAPALRADAARLAECRALGPPDRTLVSREAWAAFWAFAQEHPPLRRLHLDGKTYSDCRNGGDYFEPWGG